jgi:hypothetical protein
MYRHTHLALTTRLTSITEMHLLEYRRRYLEYLQAFEARRETPFSPAVLKPFSAPRNERGHSKSSPLGYDDKSISDEMITEVFVEFSARTRQAESEQYLRTLTGALNIFNSPTRCPNFCIISAISIVLDHTFKAPAKALVVDSHRKHTRPMKGGLLSALNESDLILAWVRFQIKPYQLSSPFTLCSACATHSPMLKLESF